jgi:hypothetical protein
MSWFIIFIHHLKKCFIICQIFSTDIISFLVWVKSLYSTFFFFYILYLNLMRPFFSLLSFKIIDLNFLEDWISNNNLYFHFKYKMNGQIRINLIDWLRRQNIWMFVIKFVTNWKAFRAYNSKWRAALFWNPKVFLDHQLSNVSVDHSIHGPKKL